jgi:Transglycosylase SLT domain
MKSAIQFVACVAAIAAAALSCLGADVAVLRNGFSIRHERRQVIGNITRLFVDGDNSSFVDVPTEEIDHFEAVPDPVQPAPTPAPQPTPQVAAKNLAQPMDINELVKSASGTYNLDPDLVASVIHAESGFNVRAVSPKGAQGLMQLMPQTASELGVRNAFDPQANVDGGTRYLRELLERYNFDLIKALAAYNAGPERVEQYGGVPPYYETKAYVARIVRDFNKKKLAQQKNAAQAGDSQKTSAAKKPNSKTNAKPGTATAKSQSSSASAQADATGSR